MVETVGVNVESVIHIPPNTNPYYYWVAAYNAGGETTRVSLTNSPISSVICASNLINSSKTVTQVNGNAYTPGDSLRVGDVLTFRITLSNDLGEGEAYNISISDKLINLKVPAGGWQATYNGAAIPGALISEAGTAPNQTLTFDLTNSSYNIPVGAQRLLVFKAEIAVPTGFNGATSRMQNSATINYQDGPSPVTKSTPLLLFNIGSGGPNIIEVP